jgi:hypothetical protein
MKPVIHELAWMVMAVAVGFLAGWIVFAGEHHERWKGPYTHHILKSSPDKEILCQKEEDGNECYVAQVDEAILIPDKCAPDTITNIGEARNCPDGGTLVVQTDCFGGRYRNHTVCR